MLTKILTTKDVLGGMRNEFRSRSFLGFIHREDNQRCVAGHIRLFGKPGEGLTVFRYNQTPNGWALHRTWNFGLFMIHHVGEGKYTHRPGYHVRFMKLEFKKLQGGFSFRVVRPNPYSLGSK